MSGGAMCNSIQTRAKYCPKPCCPEKCVPPLLPDNTMISGKNIPVNIIGFNNVGGGTTIPYSLGADQYATTSNR